MTYPKNITTEMQAHIKEQTRKKTDTLRSEVGMIMAGDNPELIMQIVANEPDIEAIISDICCVEISHDCEMSSVPATVAFHLSRLAMKLNQAILNHVTSLTVDKTS